MSIQDAYQWPFAGMLIRLATSSARARCRQDAATHYRTGKTPVHDLSDVPKVGNIPDLQPILVPDHQQLLLLLRRCRIRSQQRNFAEGGEDHLVVRNGRGRVLRHWSEILLLRGVWMVRHVRRRVVIRIAGPLGLRSHAESCMVTGSSTLPISSTGPSILSPGASSARLLAS